jgi:ABC-2 type transport system permease protein
MLQRILSLIAKESQTIYRDKKSRMLLIVPPIVQTIVFAFAATLDVKNVSLAVLNEDRGRQGFELVQRFCHGRIFTHIDYLENVAGIQTTIDSQKSLLVLHIPSDFSQTIARQERADVQLILDARRTNAAQICLGYATRVVNTFNEELLAERSQSRQRAVVAARTWFNPNKEYVWFSLPSLVAVLTAVEALLLTGLSVARERELGTFDQLLVSPLQPFEILIGKSIPAMIAGTAEGTFIIAVATLIFGIPFEGSLGLLYFAMGVFLLAMVGVGLFISSLVATQQQALLGVFMCMIPLVQLSGFATPVENMPRWLQIINLANPMAYFMTISKGVFLKDMGLGAVSANTWPMAVIAVITLTAATWLFRKRLA